MSRRGWLIALALAATATAGGGWWWQQLQSRLPAGIASGNGRLEAEQVDVATRFAGRMVEILVGEGALVAEDQVVARMDTGEIEAQLRQAEAEVRRNREAVAEAQAQTAQRQAELELVGRNLYRTLQLAAEGHVSHQRVDQERMQQLTAQAGAEAALRRADAAREAVDAAVAAADRIREQMQQATLRAPRAGRVQYRLAQAGEVLPAGGKVLTLLDLTDVSMAIFLPTAEAGRIAIGAPARVLLDAVPGLAVPARVSFVAAQAQFTPRQVETRSEREKLMYRVRVQLPPALLRRYEAQVKVGLTGAAYVPIAPGIAWPAALESDLTRQDWWAQ
ncbi:MAG: HlyD family efflux transporter periplasmic adaptor subunit [Acetobacteraceae bacterium]|nr:HlyD family efflux transporter periplasmic adaptor subunit [Acetobacteraceae bacterium]